GTGVTVSSGGVTISGAAHDVWIFQIAQNLELASGAIVTLSGGAQASNIFWQVAGQVTLGTTAAMKGVVLCQTAIVMSTGATLNGRGLAQTAITLDANTITKPSAAVAVRIDATPSKVKSLQTFRNHSVEFTVPSNGTATLRIVNLFGQEIATLFSGVAQAGKRNRVQCNTSGLTQGLYFTKLEFNGTVTLMKMSFSAQ
ncbi:MAG TPA: ice-binding family protein, partial [Chitinivibrionales bacterium]